MDSVSDDEADAAPQAGKAAASGGRAKDATGGGLSEEQFRQLLQAVQGSRSGGAAEELDLARFKNPLVRDAAAVLREATDELKKDKRIGAGAGGRERGGTDGPRGACSPDRRPHAMRRVVRIRAERLPGDARLLMLLTPGCRPRLLVCTCRNAC